MAESNVLILDDGGREAAGYWTLTSDCVARAIAILLHHHEPQIPRALCYMRALLACAAFDGTRDDDGAHGEHRALMAQGFMTFGVREFEDALHTFGLLRLNLPEHFDLTWDNVLTLSDVGSLAVLSETKGGKTSHVHAVIAGKFLDLHDIRKEKHHPTRLYTMGRESTRMVEAMNRLAAADTETRRPRKKAGKVAHK